MANFFDKIGEIVGRSKETIDVVTSGNIGVITQSTGFIRFLWWVKFIFWFLAITTALVVIFRFWVKYNKRVLVKTLKGNSVIDCYMDRGKVFKDERKKEKLSLLRTRKTCPVPSHVYTSKMGKLDFYELYLDEKGNLYPISDNGLIRRVNESIISDKNIDFHILSSWRLEEMKLAEDKFRKSSFFKEHLPEILIFMSMVICLGMVWVTMKGIESAGVQHAQAISELARSLASLR